MSHKQSFRISGGWLRDKLSHPLLDGVSDGERPLQLEGLGESGECGERIETPYDSLDIDNPINLLRRIRNKDLQCLVIYGGRSLVGKRSKVHLHS